MQPRTVVQAIASAVVARLNCRKSDNVEWFDRHSETIKQLAKDCLPSGSGIDSGTSVDLDKSTGTRIVLHTHFHHMNEGGMYDGWTDHTIIVTPAFEGIDLNIRGRNRNAIKDYLYETFDYELTRLAPQWAQPTGVQLAQEVS